MQIIANNYRFWDQPHRLCPQIHIRRVVVLAQLWVKELEAHEAAVLDGGAAQTVVHVRLKSVQVHAELGDHCVRHIGQQLAQPLLGHREGAVLEEEFASDAPVPVLAGGTNCHQFELKGRNLNISKIFV